MPVLSCGKQTLGCGMWDLVSWPGIEPRPSALGARILSHWTTREVPNSFYKQHGCGCVLALQWWGFQDDGSLGEGQACGGPQGLGRSQNPRIENSARDQTGSTCSENEWMSDRVESRHPSRESLAPSLWTEDCPLSSLGTEKLTTLGIQRHFKAMHPPTWNWNFLKCMNFLKSVYMFIVESLKNTNRDNEKNWKHLQCYHPAETGPSLVIFHTATFYWKNC